MNVLGLAVWALKQCAEMVARAGDSKPIQIFYFGERCSVEIPWELDLETVRVMGLEVFSTPGAGALWEVHTDCPIVGANNPRRKRDSFLTTLTGRVRFPPPFRIPVVIAMGRSCT